MPDSLLRATLRVFRASVVNATSTYQYDPDDPAIVIFPPMAEPIDQKPRIRLTSLSHGAG